MSSKGRNSGFLPPPSCDAGRPDEVIDEAQLPSSVLLEGEGPSLLSLCNDVVQIVITYYNENNCLRDELNKLILVTQSKCKDMKQIEANAAEYHRQVIQKHQQTAERMKVLKEENDSLKKEIANNKEEVPPPLLGGERMASSKPDLAFQGQRKILELQEECQRLLDFHQEELNEQDAYTKQLLQQYNQLKQDQETEKQQTQHWKKKCIKLEKALKEAEHQLNQYQEEAGDTPYVELEGEGLYICDPYGDLNITWKQQNEHFCTMNVEDRHVCHLCNETLWILLQRKYIWKSTSQITSPLPTAPLMV
ncbi:uncharacterized protein [Apostichopus japonicus]|uniref:uncharacterized protein isoform X2 n=1 Tax=Stichopus japonicus TaxID=307972 RepID=UPI003AB2361E